MGNSKSKNNIEIYNTGNFYTAYVKVGEEYQILCQSSDILKIKQMIKSKNFCPSVVKEF